MIDKNAVILVILVYMGILFLIAYWAEKNKSSKIVNSPYNYALSLAVYCSAWTYYGSVGIAAREGVDFLPIYLGPVIASPLWIFLLRKVIQLSKIYNVSSIADFISLRYGNSRSIGAIVTIICALSIIPYIALQLKAVSESFKLISNSSSEGILGEYLLTDTTFYIALLLAIFASFYGTLNYDASQQKRGLFFAVSVESVIKLLIFLIIGIYVCFVLFDSPSSIIKQAQESLDYNKLTTVSGIEGAINWYFMIALSFVVVFLLPRQFQAGVVEYQNTKQLHKAIWVFPLYLLLFNVFVVFIAYGGLLTLDPSLNPDYYSLLLPRENGNSLLSGLVFIGGFSAVISMVVVSTLALSTMLSNNLIIPYGFINRFQKKQHSQNQKLIKTIRRVSIFSLITIAYLLYAYVNPQTSLFSIGLISFLLISQLAPAFFLGLFWNRGSAFGAKCGMLLGLLIVVLNLIIPFFKTSIYNIENQDLIGLSEMFNFGFLDPVNTTFFWSIFFNTFTFVIISLIKKGNYRERNYGEIFVNSTESLSMKEDTYVWKGEANVEDIINIWNRFLGEKRALKALRIFKKRYNIKDNELVANSRFINFSEKLLTGAIGSASSKILIGKVIKEKPVSLVEVLKILEENKETLSSNKLLKQQSYELTKMTEKLQKANLSLKKQDQLKDDFLNAVAHELKTPITSIKASCEVIQEDEEMPFDIKKTFLENIIFDTKRITNLINDILDLEKLASGRQKIKTGNHDILALAHQAIKSLKAIIEKKSVEIKVTTNQESIVIEIDKSKMLQVITNILSNALKYVNDKTGEILIDINLSNENCYIIFKDNGKGISDIDKPFIFDKFYQSSDQSFIKPVGSGFGLAICKQIIDLHQGEIWLDNNYNNGAKFIVKLPKSLTYV